MAKPIHDAIGINSFCMYIQIVVLRNEKASLVKGGGPSLLGGGI